MATVQERVAAGVAVLDQHGPAGWRERINVETLDVRYSSQCVLGQVYHGYSTGLSVLVDAAAPDVQGWSAREAWADDHGFHDPIPDTYDEGDEWDHYAPLTAEWLRQLVPAA